MKEIKVWTDGACFPNPGMGGWAWTCLDGKSNSGSSDKTTNQVMELTAAHEALLSLYRPDSKLIIISDSMYVIKGATLWCQTWLKNGWKNSKGLPVANKSLWEVFLMNLFDAHNVEFQWVKGHSFDPGNTEADRLATHASKASVELIEACTRKWHR